MSDKAALESVHATLSGDGTVTGLVGTRIYRDFAPQGATLPLVVIRLVVATDENKLEGGADISDRRIEAISYGGTSASADGLSDAVYEAMIAAGHYRISAVRFYNEETDRHQHIQDFTVWSSR